MFKALLALLMTSILHGQPLAQGDFAYKTYWEREPLLSVQPIPTLDEKNTVLQEPNLTAESAMVIDLNSAKILYQKNAQIERPIASLTKLMTALIVAEEETPYTIIKVSEEAAGIDGSTSFLNAGEELTVKDLTYGMMIASGNDAAMALALYNAGSMENFVRKMNDRAQKLGLQNTHFSNPMGFDAETNFSTAQDMALISLYVLQNEFLTVPANLTRYEFESKSGIFHEFVTTNELLNKELSITGLEGVTVEGLKTGRTPEAGECLIAVGKDGDGNRILTVVLGSKARFQDTQKLIEWTYGNYQFPNHRNRR